MEFTSENIVALIGYILLFIGTYLTFRDKTENTGVLKDTSKIRALIDLNQAVDLANARALRAEEETAKVEKRAEDREKALEELANMREQKMIDRITVAEEALNALRDYLSYRMTFRVKLGVDPVIEDIHIEHYPDRRKEDVTIENDRREYK